MKTLALLLCLGPGVAAASVHTVCGVRDGTAGNAWLVNRGRPVLELGRQGGEQNLVDQADQAVGPQPGGETGTQNGARYCLRVRFENGRPVAILSGRRIGDPAR